MAMKVSQLINASDFLDIAGGMLYANETENNLILGVAERLVRDPEAYQNPFFAVVSSDDGALLLAVLMTPPHNLILAGDKGFQAEVSALVDYLKEYPQNIPGVIGPAHIARRFARTWQNVMKQTSQLHMRQKVYELRAVHLPPMPSGHFRIALSEDIPKIAVWLHAFEREALGKPGDSDPERSKTLIDKGKVFVWEYDEMIVSMAIKTRPIAHSITISGVYTPPGMRRQGYATALVARLSQHLLDSGYQFVNLFTDLANSTSNSIYRKIGYHPVCDFRMYDFVCEGSVGG
ncbi:MAG: GNAT family N-acetyltransferase [Chloroflexota bacterium]|nr:GNAT family N-acetyltransferase [Chloroflexota bacterium]